MSGRNVGTRAVTKQISAALQPVTPEAELALSMATLTDNVRQLVETALLRAWKGQQIEIAWQTGLCSLNGETVTARVGVIGSASIRLVGTVTFYAVATGCINARISTAQGHIGIAVEQDVIRAVVA